MRHAEGLDGEGTAGSGAASREAPGTEAEFREFAIGRWPALVRFAYGLTGDTGHAEDLAQITLSKAYASWGRVRRAMVASARWISTSPSCGRMWTM